MQRRIIIYLWLSIQTVALFAQRSAIGSWHTYLSYAATTQVAVAEEVVYGLSNGALYSVRKDDRSLRTYGKQDGLSDNTLHLIAYASENKTLFIAYDNSNFDLLDDDGSVHNISDLMRKSMSGDKTVNDVFFVGTTAYVACAFGIIVIDMKRLEVLDTYIIGTNATNVNVRSLCFFNHNIYAVTPDAVYVAQTEGVNLANYANWHLMSGLPAGKNCKMVTYNGALYLLQEGGHVHRFSSGIWSTDVYTEALNLCTNNGWLFAPKKGSVRWQHGGASDNFVYNMPYQVIYDAAEQCFWIASEGEGVGRVAENLSTYYFYYPDGPIVNNAWRMAYADGKLIVVPGGRWTMQYFRQGYVMIYENNKWTNITHKEITDATGLPCTDFVDVAIDPVDNTHFFVASYGTGLYEFRNNAFYKLYNADNSGIESVYPDQKPSETYYIYQRVDGLNYDDSGRLWMVNPLTQSVIKYMTPDGIVHPTPFSSISSASIVHKIEILRHNKHIKLVLLPHEPAGVFAIYDNGTPDDFSDDRTITCTSFLDRNGKNIPYTFIYDMTQDHDGTIWLGTDNGVILLENPSNIFNDDYTASRIVVTENTGTDNVSYHYLLDGTQVNAITIDGANRKWIGTAASGVLLLSADGKQLLHHFTAENSPLLSNMVQCIGINSRSGEVFFGTGSGIIAYQSDAEEGGVKFGDVHAFPNPVREDYHGPISITGLVAETRVKITDIAGNVVYETVSNGGLATWNGTRRGGERVATGVYLAICISKDGTQKAIAKILVIN